jgi:hypothetical protein
MPSGSDSFFFPIFAFKNEALLAQIASPAMKNIEDLHLIAPECIDNPKIPNS